MKCQIRLGVLSVLGAFDSLSMILGIIYILIIASLTTYGSYVLSEFKLNYREVYRIDDATKII